jgi:hypothetical protein
MNNEALFLVLDHLSLIDVLIASRVSTQWRRVSLSVLRSRHKIEVLRLQSHGRRHHPTVNCYVESGHVTEAKDRVVITSSEVLEEVMDCLSRYCPNINIVNMTGLFWIRRPDEVTRIFSFFISEYPSLVCFSCQDLLLSSNSSFKNYVEDNQNRLKHLTINSMTEQMAISLISHYYPFLESLDVHQGTSAMLSSLPFGLKRFKILSTNFTGFISLTNSPSRVSLEYLSLTLPLDPLDTRIEDVPTFRKTRPLPKLKSLELKARFGSKEILTSFLRSLSFSHELIYLTMDVGMNYSFSNFIISDETFSNLFSNTRKLKFFRLSRYIHDTTFIPSLVFYCSNIEKLYFADCGLTDEFLKEISLLPSLQSLEIQTNRKALTSDSVMSILHGRSRQCLKKLVVTYTRGNFASDEIATEVVLLNSTFKRLNHVNLRDSSSQRIELMNGILMDFDNTHTRDKKNKPVSQRITLLVNANPWTSWRNQFIDLFGKMLLLRGTPWFLAKLYMLLQVLWNNTFHHRIERD